MGDKNDNWEPVLNLDYTRRKVSDWENIYGVSLSHSMDDRLWSEYEWSYNMCNSDYKPNNKNFEKLALMELRAMELNRDLFMGATLHEREILIKKYIETEWVRRKLNILS